MKGRALIFAVGLAASVVAAQAVEPPPAGVKDIVLHGEDGKAVVIGTVTFTPDGDKSRFAIAFDDSKFAEYFLSMREFKCVEGPDILCHVPYPYANPGTITADDPTWLEHALLFFYKRPKDYGAKMTQGLIYALTPTPGGFAGIAHSIDLDEIAVPPDDLAKPFFTGDHRYALQPGTRWFESLTIEPHR
jgi:hypothetical protein